jgi:hypothetical protein
MQSLQHPTSPPRFQQLIITQSKKLIIWFLSSRTILSHALCAPVNWNILLGAIPTSFIDNALQIFEYRLCLDLTTAWLEQSSFSSTSQPGFF